MHGYYRLCRVLQDATSIGDLFYIECIGGNLLMDYLAEYYLSTWVSLAMCWALWLMHCRCNHVFVG